MILRSRHTPVLLKEVLEVLALKPGETVIDATLGGGGHARAMLKAVGSKGRFLGIDADEEAVENFNKKIAGKQAKAKSDLAKAVRGNFRDIAKIVEAENIKPDAILFDFGISSDQLDNPARGFSFQAEGPLDMRLSRAAQEVSAADLIEKLSEEELTEVIKTYGEEKNARKIAKAVVIRRRSKPVEGTADLFEIIKFALPGKFRFKAGDVARRTFQALRIKVNNELEVIGQGLGGAFKKLSPGGRLAAISFHSLEDRIVKQYFSELAQGCTCPPEFPVCVCKTVPQGQVLTSKPIRPTPEEEEANPRSKSAKLRAIKKL